MCFCMCVMVPEITLAEQPVHHVCGRGGVEFIRNFHTNAFNAFYVEQDILTLTYCMFSFATI